MNSRNKMIIRAIFEGLIETAKQVFISFIFICAASLLIGCAIGLISKLNF